MPDRAVVDERTAYIAGYEAGFGDRYYEHSEPEASYSEWVSAARPEIPRDPQPRAIVAISEDRQWLVVLDPEPEDWDEMHFNLFHFSRRWWTWEHELLINDTGQSAHEVLREWMEGRDVKEDHPSAADETPAGVRADL